MSFAAAQADAVPIEASSMSTRPGVEHGGRETVERTPPAESIVRSAARVYAPVEPAAASSKTPCERNVFVRV
jgi:hypothetical protein